MEAPVGVLTQRYDNKRTGANLKEIVLTVQSVSSPDFQRLYTIPVSGQVYAQPLLVPRVTWTDGTLKDVLIVATMQNQVSAFQVDDAVVGPAFPPVLLWQRTLAPAVPANFMPMSSSTLLNCFIVCWLAGDDPPPTPPPLPPVGTAPSVFNGFGFYNINPSIGIVSTPVMDPATETVYLVCKSVDLQGSVQNQLFAINLLTGAVIQSASVGSTKGPGNAGLVFTWVGGTSSDSVNGRVFFDQMHQMQRPALLLQNGRVYVAFGSHQDTRPWHGWIFSYDAMTLEQNGYWCATPNGMGGSIWQAGNGIVGGDDGKVYVMTGNGDEDPQGKGNFGDSNNAQLSDFAEHFIQFDSNLSILGSFAPSNADQMDCGDEDLDLGSSGPVMFPEQNNGNILFGGGKDSRLFVLDTNSGLGMRQIFQAGKPVDPGTLKLGTNHHHIHGAPVLWRSSKNGMNLYVWPERDFLREFHWNDTTALLECKNSAGVQERCQDGDSPTQQSAFESPVCVVLLVIGCWSMPGGILSISADGNTSGTGVLWASMPKSEDSLTNIVPGNLHALDADDITHELWNSERNPTLDGGFMFAKYNPPVVANGRVYLATFGSIPANGLQGMTGSVNVYGLKQWAKFIWDGVSASQVQTMRAGQQFTDQVVVQNVGTTTWKAGMHRLGSQSPQDNTTWGASRFDQGGDVGPGQFAAFNLTLTAPSAPGTYIYQWRMVQENVEWFGDLTPRVAITVVP